MNIDPKIQARMRKLLELAQRGVGGEKENAGRMLDKLLARHGCTIDDLLDEDTRRDWVVFKVSGKPERQLLVQLACKVRNVTSMNTRQGRGVVAVELTKSEAVDMRVHFEILRKALKAHLDKEIKLACSAFYMANKLFPDAQRDEPTTEDRMTTQELMELMDAMRKVKPTPLARQLEG